MATVHIFSSLDNAVLSLKKKLQREQVFLKYKQSMYFTPKGKKKILKKVENMRRRARKKSSMSNND